MDVNKIKIVNSPGDKEIVVPISTNWDLLNRESAIIDEESKIIKEVIGTPPNYELQRFSRQVINQSTAQIYQFNFYNESTTLWEPSYLSKFPESLVRYSRGAFSKSFFKLDLFDSDDPKKQKIYLSIILPTSNSSEILSTGTVNCEGYFISKIVRPNDPVTTVGVVNFTDCCGIEQSLLVTTNAYVCVDPAQPIYFSGYSFDGTVFPFTPTYFEVPIYLNGEGENEYVSVSNNGICECIPDILPPIEPPNLTFPNFYLDHFSNSEGYYIYWYQNENLIGLNTFYMNSKFFDASTGRFIRFTNIPQTQTKIPNGDLYYRVILDYNNKSYKITNTTDLVALPEVNWYEYNNPKII